MEIYELRSFAVLAEQLHFGRAANALNLSQPALTKQIRKIEAELGGALFDRGTKGTRLTALGSMWLPQAREILGGFDRLIDEGKKGAQGKTGRLRIGFGVHGLDLVPQVITRLRSRSPELQIALQDMSTLEQVNALREGRLDLGFVRTSAGLGPGYARLPVLNDRLALVGAESGSPSRVLKLKDCRDEPFVLITPDRSPGFHQHVLRLCASHGFHPRIVQEVREFPTAIALVRAGMGVTVVPQSSWRDVTPGVRCHRIADRDAAWSVSAVWRKGDSNPVLAAFLDELKAVRAAGSA
ncbi:LysR family transcriptional regulator [Luteolibacter marinus]|uniref:LysR family transcriptional regulator n=1 Tax=Luteolibacter marinus TaxID=2776705 RepID=UPI0018671399|nr:LysR family transcriptional regulator [Luteolibacter marinus]